MGLSKGTASYLRFIVDGDEPKSIGQKFEELIEARRFAPIAPETGQLESSGWAPVEAPLDDERPITRVDFLFEDRILLSYREDRMSFPRALVDHQVDKKMQALEESGAEITRKTKQTVHEAVISELSKRVLPKTRCVDLCWDLSRRRLRIFGGGPIATERAPALFERTFGRAVHLDHYGRRAFEQDLSTRATGILERLQPEPVFGMAHREPAE